MGWPSLRAAGTPGRPLCHSHPCLSSAPTGLTSGLREHSAGQPLRSIHPPLQVRGGGVALAGRGPLLWGHNAASGEMGGVGRFGWGSSQSRNDPPPPRHASNLVPSKRPEPPACPRLALTTLSFLAPPFSFVGGGIGPGLGMTLVEDWTLPQRSPAWATRRPSPQGWIKPT